MKTKKRLLLLYLIAFSLYSQAGKPRLYFNEQQQFKILQFTDTHLGEKEESCRPVLEMMHTVLKMEKPDLVIFTGDIVLQNNARQRWDSINTLMSHFNLPWAVVYGNHEEDSDLKRSQITQLLKSYPNCLNTTNSATNDDSNFVLPILNKQQETGALLYGFDSHSYSTEKNIKGYGWIQLSQLQWYKKYNDYFTRKNHNTPLPALAFLHIPLPEYRDMAETKDVKLTGIKNEKVASGALNSGLFAQLIAGKDVMGVFCGHDHNNDYIGIYNGIALGYGRFGLSTPCWYNNMVAGARIIVLKQGQRCFDTWIRTPEKVEFFFTFR